MSPRRAASLIALAAAIPFLPALSNGWVNWDDGMYLLDNPHFRGLSLGNLRWMFTASVAGHYQPLSWLTYASDHALWGMNPAGYHLTNILLHAANAALVFLISRRLLARAAPGGPEADLTAGAALAALLFALHPLRVEPVVWAAQRRDGLSALFCLGTVLAYLRGAGSASPRDRRLALALYGAALLSKVSAMTLPLSLLVLDAYPLRRPWRAALREKVPYLALAAAAGGLGAWFQFSERTAWTWEQYGLWPRAAQSVYGLYFYLGKTLLPVGLSPIYELAPDFSPSAASVLPAAAALAAALIWAARSSRGGAWLAAFAHYGLTLAPMLGLAQSGPQIAADRYSYLACVSWAVLAGAGLRGLLSGSRRASTLAAAAAVLAALGAASWRQARFWRDSAALWSRAVSVEPGSALAWNNLGMTEVARGRPGAAAEMFERALRLNGSCLEDQRRLAELLGAGHRSPETSHLARRLESNPVCRSAAGNFAAARAAAGDPGPALRHFTEVLTILPRDAAARSNLQRARAMSLKTKP